MTGGAKRGIYQQLAGAGAAIAFDDDVLSVLDYNNDALSRQDTIVINDVVRQSGDILLLKEELTDLLLRRLGGNFDPGVLWIEQDL